MNQDSFSTCWTTIEEAARGEVSASERFARLYGPVVRSYLRARWRDPGLLQEVDDALQAVMLECFKSGGALQKADPDRGGGFRAFLHGVTRKIALRTEERRHRGKGREVSWPSLSGSASGKAPAEDDLHRAFDRAWAAAVMREAFELMESHPQCVERARMLRMRFEEGKPAREIALVVEEDVEIVYRELARARKDFQRALLAVVRGQLPGATTGEIEAEGRALLEKLR